MIMAIVKISIYKQNVFLFFISGWVLSLTISLHIYRYVSFWIILAIHAFTGKKSVRVLHIFPFFQVASPLIVFTFHIGSDFACNSCWKTCTSIEDIASWAKADGSLEHIRLAFMWTSTVIEITLIYAAEFVSNSRQVIYYCFEKMLRHVLKTVT